MTQCLTDNPETTVTCGAIRGRVAYLVSVYPGVSHTFVMREIMAIRREGIEVDTFSIRTPAAHDLLSQDDRRERTQTYYILPPRPGAVLAAHLRTLFTRPGRYFETLWYALTKRPAGLRALLWHLFYFAEAVVFWNELRRRGIKHCHVHFAMACATVALIASRLGDLTYSMTVHGPTVFFDVHRFMVREKVERARVVFCISDFCRSQVMAHVDPKHWPKLHIVHCGVQSAVYRPRPENARNSATRNVLCVGRLCPEKAQSLLLTAIGRLHRSRPDLRCTFVGDGPDRLRLEALRDKLNLQSVVTFAGAVGQDHIQEYYDAADVFVLASFAEGLPVVLMEAMAKQIPVVATRIAGIPELVEDGVTGLVVPPGNIDALTDAIGRLLDHDSLRSQFAVAGRRKILDEFEMDAIGRRIADLVGRSLPADRETTRDRPQ